MKKLLYFRSLVHLGRSSEAIDRKKNVRDGPTDGLMDRPTDRLAEGPTDGPTKWGVESRSTRLKRRLNVEENSFHQLISLIQTRQKMCV